MQNFSHSIRIWIQICLSLVKKDTNLRRQSLKEWASSSCNPQDLQKKDAGWRYKSPSGRLCCQVCRNSSSTTPTKVQLAVKCIIWNPSSRADSTSSQRAAVASPVRFILWRTMDQWEKYPATWTASEFGGGPKFNWFQQKPSVHHGSWGSQVKT